MTTRDYYEVLESRREATPDELKKSYRRLAMEHHPDRNSGDDKAAERFKEVTEAYQVLSDPDRRARYDRFGHDAPGVGFGGGGVEVSSMIDFFESVFGSVFGGAPSRRGRGRGKPGRDLQFDLSITLEQAARGTEVKIKVPRPVRCESCGGSGSARGSSPQRCSRCDGIGSVRLQQGFFSVTSTCPSCGGEGEVIGEPCAKCEGLGLTVKEEEVETAIPAGVDDGAVKVIPGGGEHGRGGAPDGDLHVMVHLERHELFERRGKDLHGVVEVSYPQAVLGAELEVPTINGPVKMKVKPGTEGGQVYRLRGKGMPSLRGSSKGDHLVHIEINIPKKPSPRQKVLIEELGQEFGDDAHPAPRTLVDKLKDWLE